MEIKNKFITLIKDSYNCNNNEVVSKVAELKGLYSAYEISQNEDILNKIIEGLLDIVDILLKTPANNTQKAILNKNNKIGELSDFFDYLIKNGKKPTTADGYRKAINRVIVKNSLSGIEELNKRIDEMIELYDGNDQASHNTHIAALKQYACYLYFKNSYQITLDNDNGTKQVVWSLKFDDKMEALQDEEAIRKFDEIISLQQHEYHIVKSINKWRIIRLYKKGIQIAKES